MGKAGKWIKNLLIGKKDKDKRLGGGEANGEPFETPRTPHPTTPKEKNRWSFRKSSKDFSSNPMDFSIPPSSQAILDSKNEQKKHALIVAAATAAAADAAVAAAHAAAHVINLTAAAASRKQKVVDEAAAIKIQAVYRSHLARKALRALKGLVKLQALARGHLVRKQSATTLRCMQALVTVQARARAQRIQMVGKSQPHTQILSSSIQRKSSKVNGFKQNYDINRSLDENIKVVEMDNGETRGSTKRRNIDSPNYQHQMSPAYSKHDYQYHMSPAASTLTDISPRLCSEYFLAAQQLELDKMSQNGEICPNYMANTESFRAKARSQSAPKQRTDLLERQSSSRRKASILPRAIRMQRSSSHVESTNNGYRSLWSVKLDRSMVSLKDSEFGSSSTVIRGTNYQKSAIEYDVGKY